jgi:nitronate monooxygenase
VLAEVQSFLRLIAEDAVRQFLRDWGPTVAREAGNFTLPDFAAQCEAMLDTGRRL